VIHSLSHKLRVLDKGGGPTVVVTSYIMQWNIHPCRSSEKRPAPISAKYRPFFVTTVFINPGRLFRLDGMSGLENKRQLM